MTITVSTDGSALGNPNGSMGWAWADHDSASASVESQEGGGDAGREHNHDGNCDAGGASNGTNQIGELCAVLEALRAHPGSQPLVIETDSQYAINCSTQWVRGWKRNGWRNSQKKPVKNAPLIKAIDAEIMRRKGSVKFVWVKGHAGNAGNEKVDDLAHGYAQDCRRKVRDGYLPREGWQSLMASEYARNLDVPDDARMLLDGRITPEEYHLGRGMGGALGDSSSVKGSPRGKDGNPPFSHPSAPAPTEVTTAPVPHGQSFDHGATAPIETVESDAIPSSGSAGADPATNDIPRKDETPVVAQTCSDDGVDGYEPDDDTAMMEDDDSDNIHDQQKQRPSEDGSAAPKQATPSVGAPRPVKGLRVSGTLSFSPPPQSSPTFDGRPRLVRGSVAVEGYVNADGTMMVSDASFYIDQPERMCNTAQKTTTPHQKEDVK